MKKQARQVKKDKTKAEVKREKDKKTKKTKPAKTLNVEAVEEPMEQQKNTRKRKDRNTDAAAPLKKTKGASGSKASSSKAGEADLKVKEELMEILGTCPEGGCDHEHHRFRIPKYDDFQFSIYWTRNAVGVKYRSSKLEDSKSKVKNDSKPKKDTFKQVGYFSHGSCSCCNLFLACKWVSHQHQKYTLKSTIWVHVVYKSPSFSRNHVLIDLV